MKVAVTSFPQPRRRGFCGILLAWIVAGLHLTACQVRAADEYDLKAVMILKIAQLSRWASDSFPDAAAPFTIGVLGEDPFGRSLEDAVRSETIQGRKFAVKRGRNAATLKGCQIVFISRSESSRLGEALGALTGKGILTIGETPGFCAQGGVMNFTFAGGSVAIEISLSHVTREHLKPNTQLLNKARQLP
jgi:hypothetical protein